MSASPPSTQESPFDGTWRPDYGPPGPDAEPDSVSLKDGLYDCRTCRPPYQVPADGRDHVVEGHPRFETLAVTIVDDWTVRQVGRRSGAVVFEAVTVVSADGLSRSETWPAVQPVNGVLVPVMVPLDAAPDEPRRPVLFGASSDRVGLAEPGAHAVSGAWRVTALDLVDHDEDTVYRVVDGRLTMTDKLGRSFAAPLDGTEAPYLGDPRFNGVSLRVIDERTIEETNLKDGTVVQVTRWHADPDGVTMTVRFDDLRGHVMEQTGHRIAS